jgi:asparagine synthase (glutamine-hydrolysing)
MSGLVGWVDFTRDLTTRPEVLRAMTGSLSHRGPDAEGFWAGTNAAIGHRELATRSDGGGRQPVLRETEAGPILLAFDGAIDNFPELRQQVTDLGARLRTRSEAETLLEAYAQWGTGFVERLRGMFALAIWDGRTRELLLARDRMGLKPQYYFEYPGGLLFASQPKGIMANALFEARLDLSAIPILLQPRLALAGETPLRGLRELPPAHLLRYSVGGASLRRYWQLTSAPHEHSFAETARHVRSLLEEVVQSQLQADVARGAMLSGGIDSSSVAALATKCLRAKDRSATLDTFCIQFESDGAQFQPSELRPEVDAPYAEKLARFIESRHTTVTVHAEDVLSAVPHTRQARDLPSWGQFDASMYLLFQAMRPHCSVALTGEAADELFGGYPYYFKRELTERDSFPWLGEGPMLSDYLAGDLAVQLDPKADERARYAQLMSEVPALPGEDPHDARMRQVLYLGMCGPLAVILDRKDRMSMCHGLQVRVPFCDHRLVEYVWNVPWSMKCIGGAKGLLKAAMAELLPDSTLNRKKSAYPQIQHPRYDRTVLSEAREIIEDEASPVAQLFDAPRLRQLIAEIEAGAAGNAGTSSLPGGAAPAHLLIHFVEMQRWIDSYNVTIG